MKAMSPWRLVLYGVCLLLAFGYAASAFRHESRLGVGTSVPPVKLPVHGSEAIDLGGSRDQVLVISFWASYCDPCRAEVPALNRIQKRGTAQVVGISLDNADSAGAQKLAEGLGMAYPIVGGHQNLARTFLVEALPTVYVVARDGIITFAHTGVIDEATLEEAVEAASSRRI